MDGKAFLNGTEPLPEVSVVMSVFNDVYRLKSSVESVLEQRGVSLEFVIIDDGSADDSVDILNTYASRDSRVRLVRQENTGLTRALQRGCSLARGRFIARQDAGDIYLQGKLAQQAQVLRERPGVSMVTCGTRFVGPEGEFLFDVAPTTEEAMHGLGRLDINTIRGPSSHTSMMFRKADYESVGGYRAEFVVAQDLDLWLRLIEQGDLVALPEVMIQGEISPSSISGTSHALQVELREILVECARLRRRGESEVQQLQRASKVQRPRVASHRITPSKANYFLGRLLQKNCDRRCFKYLEKAVSADPSNWKAWLALTQARLSSLRWRAADAVPVETRKAAGG